MKTSQKSIKYDTKIIQSVGKIEIADSEYLQVRKKLQKDQPVPYYMMWFAKNYEITRQLSSLVTLKVRDFLMQKYVQSSSYNTTKVCFSRKELQQDIGTTQSNITLAFQTLEDLGFLLERGRGYVVINPECVWRGSLHGWQEACRAGKHPRL
jgi:DNA-binding MarR family transcriptional regulator